MNAGQLETKCWTNSGAPLRGFQNVDKIGLHILAAETPAARRLQLGHRVR